MDNHSGAQSTGVDTYPEGTDASTPLATISSLVSESPSVAAQDISSADPPRSAPSTVTGSSNTFPTNIVFQPTPMPEPEAYIPLLVCALCKSLLNGPTTLHCGHTVCATHVHVLPVVKLSTQESSASRPILEVLRSIPPTSSQPPPPPPPTNTTPTVDVPPICPLKSCTSHASTSGASSSSSVPPNIPAGSSVAYYPAPRTPTTSEEVAPQRVRTEPKLDVTVNKVLSLVQRAEEWLREEEDQGGFVQDILANESGTEDEDELYHNPSPPPEPPASAQQRPLSRPRAPSGSPSSMHRPRKRRRDASWSKTNTSAQHSTDPWSTGGLGGHTGGGPTSVRPTAQARFEKELLSEMTCEICFMLLYQPVTTPCQHSFCAKCLQRSLDHSTACPLCREDLPGFAYFQDHPFNKVILSICLKAFPDSYHERGAVIEQEERDARLDTPIFVCQLSFPGMPTLLHFFEPRYRLMLRRCLENPNPCFGMIMPPRAAPSPTDPGNGNDYGTMLEIKSVQMLPDGRSMVETWGTHRFRILERGALDGYMVGRIERIDDYETELDVNPPIEEIIEPSSRPPSTERERPLLSRLLSPSPSPRSSSSSLPIANATATAGERSRTNEELMAVCRTFLDQLRQGTAPWVVQRLNNTYGPMPTDASSFSFWVALVLPIDEHEKSKLLPIRSARQRLRLVVHWIEQLNSNWWFSSGCIIL